MVHGSPHSEPKAARMISLNSNGTFRKKNSTLEKLRTKRPKSALMNIKRLKEQNTDMLLNGHDVYHVFQNKLVSLSKGEELIVKCVIIHIK